MGAMIVWIASGVFVAANALLVVLGALRYQIKEMTRDIEWQVMWHERVMDETR
jgi:hypothetical protein